VAQRSVPVWDLATRELIARLDVRSRGGGTSQSMAVGELDGRRVVATGSNIDGDVRLYDLQTGEMIGEPLARHTGAVMSLAIGPLGGRDMVVSGGEDGTARISRPGEPSHRTIDTGTRSSVSDVLVGPGSTLVIRKWASLTVLRVANDFKFFDASHG
jgi:WD40 repeat protein